MAEDGGLARSRRGRHGRRRKKRGPWVLEGAVAGAALLAVGLVAGGGVFGRERPQQSAGAVAVVPFTRGTPSPVGQGGAGRVVASAAAATLSPPPAPPAAPASASGAGDGSEHTDKKAAEYFHKRWGAGDKAAKRLKDIRTVGGYLRIYTDLPESAHNSAQAITLCERGLEYLREAGEDSPVVFVQAEYGENGNPVLANVLGPDDGDCRVTHPEPD
ncbi:MULTISPECIES: hypothetical protein [Nonomuraea]|uniref:Uncharacterized protein n=1 Tax=Nonomuraea mangrovi TaxID=2316207 RepID=A0ABW4SYL4_9ACTN